MTTDAIRPITQQPLAVNGRWLADPQAASAGLLVVVAFARSSAKSFPMTLGIAKTAAHFGVTEIEGQEVFVAGFGKDQADATRAAALIDRAKGWQNVLYFASGQVLRNPKYLLEYLRCYAVARTCKEPKGHCHVAIDDPKWTWEGIGGLQRVSMNKQTGGIEIPAYTFPCRLLLNSFSPDSRIPISYIDQTQAAAVRHGLNTCPCFDANALQPGDEPREIRLIPEGWNVVRLDGFDF